MPKIIAGLSLLALQDVERDWIIRRVSVHPSGYTLITAQSRTVGPYLQHDTKITCCVLLDDVLGTTYNSMLISNRFYTRVLSHRYL